MRRTYRASAVERAAGRLAAATTSDLGAWRARPPDGGQAPRHAGGGSRIAASSIDPALLPAADEGAIAVERAALAPRHVDPETGRPLLLEELRPICRALAARADAPGARRRDRLILVSSPSAGEGKTFVAVSLALVLSQAERRPVLLVDGDAQTAGAALALGWRSEPGLTDALASDTPRPGLIAHSGLARLSFVPPGRPSAASAGLLAGRRAARLMRELLASEPHGLVIVDGPPLLAGPVGPALAAHAGQVVLVIAAGRTSQRAIDDSLARLGPHDNLGCVLARPAPSTRRPMLAGRADPDLATRPADGRRPRAAVASAPVGEGVEPAEPLEHALEP